MNDDILITAAEIAEWSDRISMAANNMLVRGGNEEIAELRKLITEWGDRFNDISLDIQNAILSGNGWVQEVEEGRPGWVDPHTNVHYLAKDAIALQRLRGRKRDSEPLVYN